ncbi:MAG TPA: DNA-binding response regulator [Pseudonocardiaceae bacterium]|nr:DNA-binding response regulator [Pseudonocardiaceae bacterium]
MTTAPPTPTPPSVAGQVITLYGEQELIARAGHLFNAREEFVCAATDPSVWRRANGDQPWPEQMRARVAAGVQFRKMYGPRAVADQRDAAQLLEMAATGIQIRICLAPLAHETIIVDRRVAFIAGQVVDGVQSYSVVQTPEVVAGVRSLFFGTWQGATDLTDYLPSPPPQVDEQGLTILRLLSAGQKDETAARQLGLSVRTYRRRVAELMELLGASSRFQAGVRARELGLRV